MTSVYSLLLLCWTIEFSPASFLKLMITNAWLPWWPWFCGKWMEYLIMVCSTTTTPVKAHTSHLSCISQPQWWMNLMLRYRARFEHKIQRLVAVSLVSQVSGQKPRSIWLFEIWALCGALWGQWVNVNTKCHGNPSSSCWNNFSWAQSGGAMDRRHCPLTTGLCEKPLWLLYCVEQLRLIHFIRSELCCWSSCQN